MTLKNLKNKLLSNSEFRKEYIKKNQTELAIRVGNKVQELRALKGVTQIELAAKAKMLQPNIARIESGKSLPSLSTLHKIAVSMGTYLIEPSFAILQPNLIATTAHNISLYAFAHTNTPPSLMDYRTDSPTTQNYLLPAITKLQ